MRGLDEDVGSQIRRMRGCNLGFSTGGVWLVRGLEGGVGRQIRRMRGCSLASALVAYG